MRYSPYIRPVENASGAVLFLHGFIGTPTFFQPYIDAIPEDWSVYNILLDGHGKGPREIGGTSWRKWEKQVSAWVDEILLTHDKLVVVGYSLGNILSILEAIRRPGKISALFMINTPLIYSIPLSTSLSVIKFAMGNCKPGTLEWRITQVLGIHLSRNFFDYFCLVPPYFGLRAASVRAKKLLPQLTTPAICFQPPRDELLNHRNFRCLKAHNNVQLVRLDGSSHFHYTPEDTALMVQHLLDILDSL